MKLTHNREVISLPRLLFFFSEVVTRGFDKVVCWGGAEFSIKSHQMTLILVHIGYINMTLSLLACRIEYRFSQKQ